MKLLSQYMCEICGTVYNDKSKAEKCEKTHKVIQAVASPRYLSFGQDNTGVPVSVVVYFTDGSKATYKR